MNRDPHVNVDVARGFPLADMACRSEGGARIIDAYAAVFDDPAVIAEWDGDFEESIGAGAFAKTIAENGSRVRAIFNHARTIDGAPSDRFSMPYGTIARLEEDSRGLWSSVRMADTDLGREVYELARSGAITGMSFQGRVLQSNVRRATMPGQLDRVHVTEIALKEVGACVFPAYEGAGIVQVRARTVADQIAKLTPQDREVLARMLADAGTPSPADPAAEVDVTGVEEPPQPDTPSGPSQLLADRARLRARQAV